MYNSWYISYLINAESNSNILFCGYTSIISGLSIDILILYNSSVNIIRIKNSIIIYNLLSKNILKLIPYTLET